MNNKKLLKQCLKNPKNIRFDDFVGLIEGYGFSLSRINGSHHIFKHLGIGERINIQNVKGEAKPYQILQFLRVVEKHNLILEEES